MNLEELFRAHERTVYAYFLRLVPAREQAEDLTQETFVRACSAALRYRGDSAASTWLLGIARRVLLEAVRAGLYEHGRNQTIEALPQEAPSGDVDLRLDIEKALRSLGLADREAILLVDVLGFPPIEAASIARVTRQAFRVRLHRARARFKEAYLG